MVMYKLGIEQGTRNAQCNQNRTTPTKLTTCCADAAHVANNQFSYQDET